MDRARAVATEGRALPAGTWARIPVLGPLAARVLERLLRPYAARQREATADLVRALDALSRRLGAVEGAAAAEPPPAPDAVSAADLEAVRARGAALGADLEGLRAQLDAVRVEVAELRALLEGHARRAIDDVAGLSRGLRRAGERLDALEARSVTGAPRPGPGGDPSA